MSKKPDDKHDEPDIKQLLGSAHDQGALSARALAALDAADVGAQIQAGLGVTIDDVAASEVVLVTMMPDYSQSIAHAGNTEAVRDGHNFVIDALRGSRQSGEVLAHTRYLNGEVLCPYVALDHAVTHAVQVAPLAAPLGDEGSVEHSFAQAGPALLAGRECLQAVPVLHVAGHDSHGEPNTVRVHQGHALAAQHLLGGIKAAWAAHRDTLHRLGVDHG